MEGAIVKKVIVALVIAALTVSVTVTGAVAKSSKRTGGGADICVLLYIPFFFSPATTPLPCRTPTARPSKEM